MPSDNLFIAAGIRVCSALVEVVFMFTILLWEVGITLYNFISKPLDEGKIVPKGHPGANGNWPEYIAPKDTDSRCSCPGLNAMANHG